MKMIKQGLILSFILLAGCASTPVKKEMPQTPNLTDAQMKILLVGKTMRNQDFTQVLNGDGTTVGTSYRRNTSDKGTYTIKDGKYCSQWKQWRDGSTACWTMRKRSKDYYAMVVSGPSRSFNFTVK